MAESKVDFSFENLHFSCEGDKNWVENQLNQILKLIPELSKSDLFVKSEQFKLAADQDIATRKLAITGEKEHPKRRQKKDETDAALTSAKSPLMMFLEEKNADKNQVRKFLATAVFLHAQGEEKLTTPMVSKLLKSSQIEKLINASDCLNKNEKKGFCIKDDKEFTLTDAGIRSIIGGTEA